MRIEFGAGELEINPGAAGSLVEGTATYNVEELKPLVEVDDERVIISNGDFEFGGIPDFDNYENRWELELGDMPMDLRISAGAYQGEFDLGGLALESLRITDGAADVNLTFSSPNLVNMGTFRYDTGASSVSIDGLGNANFESMLFQSGAGDYTLDFSGDLQRDADIEVKAGLSNLTIIVPEGIDARVRFTGALTNIDVLDEWRQSGGDYFLDGSGPTLTFTIDMGAGNVTLRN
jgi:hypothetical protein